MTIARMINSASGQFKKWIEPLFLDNAPAVRTDSCAIRFSGKTVSLVYINESQGSIELMAHNDFIYDTNDTLNTYLATHVSRLNLSVVPSYWLLSPEDYQLFIIDSLPVTNKEMHQALKWRIRSLINYPVDDCVVDYFPLPIKKSNDESMIAAVVAKKNSVQTTSLLLRSCQLNLVAIDIPELAMRNLTSLHEEDEKSTAFIYIIGNIVILNITKEKVLYFTKRFNLNTSAEISSQQYEQLCLEILRYFDYYQSQWRHAAPSRIFVARENKHTLEVAESLSKYLLQTVEPFHLKSIIASESALKQLEKNSLLTLGCALRRDNNHVKSTN